MTSQESCLPLPRAKRSGALETTLLFTGFIAATYGFGLYLFPLLLTEMRGELGFGYATIGWMTGAAQAGFLVFALLSGFLSPRLGAQRVILSSVLLSALALLAMPLAEGPLVAGLLLTLLGAAAASVWVPMVEVAQARIPERHQGKALGLMSSGTSYGVFLNGLAVPPLLALYDWRAGWLAAGAVTLVLLLLAALRLRNGETTMRSTAAAPSEPLARRLAALRSFRAAAVWLMMFLNGLACMPFQTYLSAFVREELVLAAETAGALWSLIGLIGMGSGLAIGTLADRITVKGGLLVTYALLLLAAALLWLHPGTTALFLAAAAFGLAFYAIFGLVPAYISLTFPSGSATLVFGIGNVALGLGGLLGNLAGGRLREDLGSFEPTYLMIALASLGLVLLTLLLPRDRRREVAR